MEFTLTFKWTTNKKCSKRKIVYYDYIPVLKGTGKV